MKKNNNKGFFLSETMIVITIVTVVLLGVFKIFSSVYTKYKDSENYNTVNATIAASSLKNYYKSVGIDYVTLLNGSYYVDLTNSSTYDNEYYDYLKQTLDLDKVYLIDMTKVFTGTNINIFNTSLRKYIKTLENSSSSIMLVSVSNGSEYGSAFISDPTTVTLVGDSSDEYSVAVPLKGTFIDPGYTNWDGDAPVLEWETTLDTSKIGTYYLRYNFNGYLLRRKVIVINPEYTFNYIGSVQTFTAPSTGYYKLEVWGASGGTVSGGTNGGTVSMIPGYGGYSLGIVYLQKNQNIYVYVGGTGESNCVSPTNGTNITCAGGYNGGGLSITNDAYVYISGGGGATHIATTTGLLSTLSSNQSSILIVAGGGGGSVYYNYNSAGYKGYGGSGGGYTGSLGTSTKSGTTSSSPGTQSTGYSFGTGGPGGANCSGGGSGYYGGYNSVYPAGGGGGSSYIANSLLLTYGGVTKLMYCYSCTTSSTASTLTYSTTSVSSTATANYAKNGNGYAKITWLY